MQPSCDLQSLRIGNVAYLSVILYFIYDWYTGPVSFLRPEKDVRASIPNSARTLMRQLHSALNLAFFPVLFFFSGLYYTDVASTAMVIATLRTVKHSQLENYSANSQIGVFILGMTSLAFRQTNIFWVAIFPAGLVLLERLRRRSLNMLNSDDGRGFSEAFITQSLYEQGIAEANAKDYLMTSISLVVNILDYLRAFFRQAAIFKSTLAVFWPYIALLAAFATFILANGGVVLGDKSNHVPALHLTQLFYLAAYTAFFSLPILYPRIVSLILPRNLTPSFIASHTSTRPFLTSIALLLAITLTSILFLPIIHYNTLVHPFILADNRHYVFYVFRLFRHFPWLRYALAPAYALAAWCTIQSLGLPSAAPAPTTALARIERDRAARTSQATTAWVALWLLTSALCVVTAPLVEPRYFILPWMVWRIHVPLGAAEGEREADAGAAWWHGDHRLWLETAWFGAINVATGWIFLQRPFEWAQEPGMWQRFMW